MKNGILDGVDVTLTPEQHMLVDATRALAGAGDAVATWSALVDAGFVALRLPHERGGGGASAVEVALVAEELGRTLSPVPYLGTVLTLELVAATPFDDVTAVLVEGRPGAVVLSEDLLGLSDAGVAVDVAEGALAVGVVDGDLLECEIGDHLDGIDPTRPLACASRAHALARLDPGVGRRWEALALTLLCADLVGTMHGALDGAVAHARGRTQFDRPIGSFQAVQHLCADAAVSVEGARSATWRAAWAVDALAPTEALEAARVAKAWCSEAGREVCEAAIQVWGGLGMTWECDAHRYLRRALLSRSLLGDEGHQLSLLAGLDRTEVR